MHKSDAISISENLIFLLTYNQNYDLSLTLTNPCFCCLNPETPVHSSSDLPDHLLVMLAQFVHVIFHSVKETRCRHKG